MKRIIIILISVVSIIILLELVTINNYKYKRFEEEAIPERDNNHIIGLKYIIKIDNVNDNKIECKTKIIDSILHYQNINNIDDYNIKLLIENKTIYKYKLYEIKLVSYSSREVIDISYKYNSKYILFKLNKKYIDSNKYYIVLKFKKNK